METSSATSALSALMTWPAGWTWLSQGEMGFQTPEVGQDPTPFAYPSLVPQVFRVLVQVTEPLLEGLKMDRSLASLAIHSFDLRRRGIPSGEEGRGSEMIIVNTQVIAARSLVHALGLLAHLLRFGGLNPPPGTHPNHLRSGVRPGALGMSPSSITSKPLKASDSPSSRQRRCVRPCISGG